MYPVNNHNTTNEIPQSISDAFLREKYSLTEEYAKNHPEDFAKVLLAVRCTEETLQIMDRLEQTQKEASSGLMELGEGSKILLAQQEDLIELEKKNTQALQKIADSSSELKEMTLNIVNFTKIFFKPVQSGWNHFCSLTGHRTPVALPGETPLAIEENLENTISNTDPTKQSLVNRKKNFASLLIFCVVSGGLYFLPVWEQRNL